MRSSVQAVVCASGLVALNLAGCSTGSRTDDGASTAASPGVEAGAFPATVKHVFGSTTVNQEPRRVVTVGWSDQDFVAALGVAPVGATKITWGGNDGGSTPWFDTAMQGLGNPQVTRFDDADGIPVDEIAKLQPDLILGTNSGMTKAEYAKLSKIAPTVAYAKQQWGTPWQDSLTMVGKALGRPKKAQQVAQQTRATIAAGVRKYPRVKGRTAAWVYFQPTDLSAIGIYTTGDMRPTMLREFGMVDAPIVKQVSRTPNSFSTTLSAEKAAQVKADALVFYVDDKVTVDTIRKNPLLARIPPLRSGHYVAGQESATTAAMNLPSPLSIPVAVNEFLPKVASAVAGKPAT